VIVRGGSDGDGGSAAAGKGDGWDGQERARSGYGRGALPLPRVPCCASLAAQAAVLLSRVAGVVHRSLLAAAIVAMPVPVRAGCQPEGRARWWGIVADYVSRFVGDETTTTK
jgi:hypothetical protein